MDALRHTLDVNNVLTRHPAVAHDLVVLLAAFEAVRGDALFEAYWRAQLDRLITLNPDIKKPSVPTIERSAGGSVYIYQSLNASPRGG